MPRKRRSSKRLDIMPQITEDPAEEANPTPASNNCSRSDDANLLPIDNLPERENVSEATQAYANNWASRTPTTEELRTLLSRTECDTFSTITVLGETSSSEEDQDAAAPPTQPRKLAKLRRLKPP